jgi:hydrogenase expression/formation protein HypC
MCLGIPAQLVAGDTGHPDLAMVDMGGVSRAINVGLLDDRPGPGDWVLVHMGFALQTMTAQEARDALDALGAEREAADREDALEAAMDAAAQAAEEAMAREAVAGEAVAGKAMAAEAVAGKAVAGKAVAGKAVAGKAVAGKAVAGGTAGGIS